MLAAAAGLALIAYGWFAPVPGARASESREFSSQETALLRAGKLVVRPEQRTLGGAHVMGGLSWQVVRATPATVWRAMTDVHAYARFLPAVEEARLIEAIGPTRAVFVRHRLGFISGSYVVRLAHDSAHGRIRFRLDHDYPSSLRDAWGEISVSPYTSNIPGRRAELAPGQQSVVSLAIMADVGEGLIVGLVRSNVHEWMLRVPEQLKRYVEGRR